MGNATLSSFLPERQVFVRDRSAQNDVPILCLHQVAKLLRTFSGGVQAAHQAAHAGAREVVDRNMVIFKPLQHADVRQSERAAAFQRDTNGRPVLGRCVVCQRRPDFPAGRGRLILCQRKRKKQQQHTNYLPATAHKRDSIQQNSGVPKGKVETSFTQPVLRTREP